MDMSQTWSPRERRPEDGVNVKSGRADSLDPAARSHGAGYVVGWMSGNPVSPTLTLKIFQASG